ncbi:YhfX family PLP-dependent enzyme [Photorhabdus akhurstii]|uniref:YhfX family PLP-dependent enzyme n=1 Tax=Photorhabdus akhurstii TaxID=171438 RepID=UPI00058D251D|nr:YhfX family PLP-dependent enzyme [Photorhabdus akhurstii]MBS9426966.1 YhfX family PLP-dependent enzyme [Photorhabdus akhurstii]
MFMHALNRQNPALIEAAQMLWAQGALLPDTYVIDVDQVLDNARRLLAVAEHHGIALYLMTKQVGRNAWLARKLLELGYQGVTAVDFKEARVLMNGKIPVTHVGHLVQIPRNMLSSVMQQHPEVITVFSLEKAEEISSLAQREGNVQRIMLKVYDDHDHLYPGQEAGFHLSELSTVVQRIMAMPGVKLTGLTHFPCLLWQDVQQQTLPAPNLFTLLKARDILRQAGVEVTQINAPSASSCSTLPLLAKYGVTHTEPGHALTGTILANYRGEQPERIAMLYLTEISHRFNGNSYCYGGGYYRRGRAHNALIFLPNGQITTTRLLPMDDASIDYHFPLSGEFPVGCAVMLCFRTQIFATRSDVALVSGIQSGHPVLEGLYDSQGNPILINGEKMTCE